MRKLILISMCLLLCACASMPGPTQRAVEYNKTKNYLGLKSLVTDEEMFVKSKPVDYQCDYNYATVFSLGMLSNLSDNLYVIENDDSRVETAYNYVKKNCAGLEHFYQGIDSVKSSYYKIKGPTGRAIKYQKTKNYLGLKSLVIDEEMPVKSKPVDYQCDYNYATVFSLAQLYISPDNLYVIENADSRAETAYNYVKKNCSGSEYSKNIDELMSSYYTVRGPIQRAKGYSKTNNYVGLKSLVIDEEMFVKSKPVDYQCNYNVATVYSLTQLYKSPDNLYVIENADSRAETAYNYLKKNCAGLKEDYSQNIDSLMLSYYFLRNRPGKAIIYAENSIQIAKESEQKALGELGLCSIYYQMGIRNQRDHHLKLATQYYKEHLATQKPESQSDLLFYIETFLKGRLSDISTDRTFESLKEMHQLWLEIEAITKKVVSNDTQSVTYKSASEYFTNAGDHDFADKLLNEAKKLAAAYPHKNRGAQKLDIMGAEARIKFEKGAFSEAAELYEKWVNASEMIADEKIDAKSLTYAGIAMEKAGNYDKAIMLLEKALSSREEQRSSFDVKQRGSFLSIDNARPYWSLARSYAKLYQKTKDKRFLAKSLGIDSKMRARQFGELIGLKQSDDYLQDKPPLVNDELLLNYLVTDSDIVLTALSNTWTDQFIIKKSRDEIGVAVNDVREAIAQQSMKRYEDAVANLSAVLITPIKGKLSKFPKLVVSLDGQLNLVPFSIILGERNKPMATSHAITQVPSIDYFKWIRSTKGSVSLTGNKVFVLANPQYAAKLTNSKFDSYEQSVMTRSIDQYSLFTPLPETLKEAQNIAARFGGGNTFSISGSEATKKKILSSDLSQYRYLHFATHGILGAQIPGINEPALVMAAADTFDDNFLLLSDLEKIKLNAELTVLSACDTGRGEYVNGEGVFGMSRGFLQAGSKSVLVSLWPVASDATVVFMDRFYGYLKSGKSKAESLRLTQNDFLKGVPISDVDTRSVKIIDKTAKSFAVGDSKNPFYWAPFVIIGE